MTSYNKELTLAVDLVRDASRITEWFRTKNFSSFKKNDESPVTIADFASQIFIISKIKKVFPEDQIIAEEESSIFLNSNAKELIKKCYKSLQINFEKNLKELLDYRGPSSNRQWTVAPAVFAQMLF